MELQFSKSPDGLLPAIIQDADSLTVLMLGYMNKEAYEKTCSEKKVTFFSRSRQTLWTKGETSGNFLTLVDIRIDCDQDTILVKARPHGPTCHTGADTCFNEINAPHAENFLHYLEQVISNRKKNPVEGSYTNHLFNKGINKIAQKVGEEAVELVIEAKDQNKELFLGEAADLMYHYLVLLIEKGYSLYDVVAVLQERHK